MRNDKFFKENFATDLELYHSLSEIQNMLNTIITGNQNWYQDMEVHSFVLACIEELNELKDCVSWKWWKPNTTNSDIDVENMKIEIVDFLHFLLSIIYILKTRYNHIYEKMYKSVISENDILDLYRYKYKHYNLSQLKPKDYTHIACMLLFYITELNLVYESGKIEITELTKNIKDKHDNYINELASKIYQNDLHIRILIKIIVRIVKYMDILRYLINFKNDEFILYYILKASLNIYRSKYGYRDGRYKKIREKYGEDNNILHVIYNMLSKEKKQEILSSVDKKENYEKVILEDVFSTINELSEG
ncbi:MAG: dUTP diphosphatase [Desulfurococcaceae archaeon]